MTLSPYSFCEIQVFTTQRDKNCANAALEATWQTRLLSETTVFIKDLTWTRRASVIKMLLYSLLFLFLRKKSCSSLIYTSDNSSSVHSSHPLGNRRAFAHVVSPGGGAFTILSRPGGWALRTLGQSPGIRHMCFRKSHGQIHRQRRAVCWRCLVHQGLDKLVDDFKDIFSQC